MNNNNDQEKPMSKKEIDALNAEYRCEHPHKPKEPGHDDNHRREEEREKDMKRVWDEKKKTPKRPHDKTRGNLHK